MRTHVFVPGPHTTWTGSRICESCGQPEWVKAHVLPEVEDEARLIDSRRLGEVDP